jgi:hypothetical protein
MKRIWIKIVFLLINQKRIRMNNSEELILLFTGSEIDASVLKEFLEDNGVGCIVRNDMNSAKAAGFGVGVGFEAKVLVMEKDIDKAKSLLKEFLDSFEKN